DLVVEEEDVEVEVAAQDVDQVIAPDRERVAVAGDDPHGELGARRLEAGGDGGGPAMNRMEAGRVDVVREPAPAGETREGRQTAHAGRPARAGASAPARGSRSRRTPDTSGRPGRRRSPSCSASGRTRRARS